MKSEKVDNKSIVSEGLSWLEKNWKPEKVYYNNILVKGK